MFNLNMFRGRRQPEGYDTQGGPNIETMPEGEL